MKIESPLVSHVSFSSKMFRQGLRNPRCRCIFFLSKDNGKNVMSKMAVSVEQMEGFQRLLKFCGDTNRSEFTFHIEKKFKTSARRITALRRKLKETVRTRISRVENLLVLGQSGSIFPCISLSCCFK